MSHTACETLPIHCLMNPHNSEQCTARGADEKAETPSRRDLCEITELAGGGTGFDQDPLGTRASAHS